METQKSNRQINMIARLVGDLFEIESYYVQADQIVLSLKYRYGRAKTDALLKDRLKLSGYENEIRPTETGLILKVNSRPKIKIPALNILLFGATLLTVYVVPVFFLNASGPNFSDMINQTLAALKAGRGIEFTFAIMSILLVHEMGHYVAGRRRGIITSWPYFIPAPNIIGTFGAVIKSKSPFWNRRDLIEVGAAGPIAGWIVAFGWLIYGLSRSIIISGNMPVPGNMTFSLEGESLLIRALVPFLIGNAGPNEAYLFTEAAFAGWVGLLVTAINMLPIGQLDGGHILYGLFRKKQVLLGRLAMVALVFLGFKSLMWWFFAGMGLVFGINHPPTLDDSKQPSQPARWMAWVAIVIMILSFTPVPFRW